MHYGQEGHSWALLRLLEGAVALVSTTVLDSVADVLDQVNGAPGRDLFLLRSLDLGWRALIHDILL